jgi:hypothetical protein
MGRAEDLEVAIDELVALVREEALHEQHYQAWFERYEWVFGILGFKRVLAHPVLETENGETYLPDFMAQLNSGIWEIIELKRPDTAVLKTAARRRDFYSEFSKYLSRATSTPGTSKTGTIANASRSDTQRPFRHE